MKWTYSPRGQAMPTAVCPIPQTAFADDGRTSVYWLGGAGVLLNSRGTCLMIDPVLTRPDMPELFAPPISPEQVPHLAALLITHIDGDHFSRPTCRALAPRCERGHAPCYVAGEMEKEGLPSVGHGIGEWFSVGSVTVTLTPADHTWQKGCPGFDYREWSREDACGFLLDTPEGRVWMPGDSRLLPEHLTLTPAPDVILLDFSDDSWHISFEGAVTLANAYPEAALIAVHWGTTDAPESLPFNGDPARLYERVTAPERLHILAPGEAFIIK